MKLANPYYEVLSSLVHPSEYLVHPLGSRLQYARDFRIWQSQVRTGPAAHHDGAEKLTVILLSYKRIRNMEPHVASLLRTDCVEKIVLSNNNPEYRIRDWVRIQDERLHLFDQPQRTPPGIRFDLAAREPGPYYLTIDDDVLLAPGQVLGIFRHLIANRSVPHGFQGEV